MAGQDLYKFFRAEAAELLEGLGQGALALEKGNDPDRVTKMLRFAHTLKGAARVVRQPAIAQLAHQVEDALLPCRDANKSLSHDEVSALLKLLDEIGAQVAAAGAAPPRAAAPAAGAPGGSGSPTPANPPEPAAASDEGLSSMRVEVKEVDAVLQIASEAAVRLAELRQQLPQLEGARSQLVALLGRLDSRRGPDASDANAAAALALAEGVRGALDELARKLGSGMDGVERELTQVIDTTHKLRLVPARTIFPSLERAARDAAQLLHREVDFEAVGGEHRLDAHVLASLRDALVHAVRNAVAHGLEPAAERTAAGKPPAGRVEIRVERRASQMAFVCRDDGRGVDVEAVRRAAVERGRCSAAEAGRLTREEVIALAFEGGLTTSTSLTEVSGRGVGLDAVRAAALRLEGSVRLKSEPMRGTQLEICVPITLSSMVAVAVESEGALASIPLDAVKRVLRLSEDEVVTAGGVDSVLYLGSAVPLAPLGRLLGRENRPAAKSRNFTALVLASGEALAAVAVDRLLGTSQLVMKPIPAPAVVSPVVAGASLDRQGDPRLVLNPSAVIEAVRARRATSVAAAIEAQQFPVLVIDDSLTTRMLEQSILEAAGYPVELATSAEEALEKARDHRYSLFVVDVDMPGMNGFEFVAHTRAHPSLKEVPAVLVTSRNSPEDLRRGEEAGASAYIVKGEFDQGYLLDTIRRLTGAEAH